MINFNKVILHNFGSYYHAEVDLTGRGFCLVTGENHRVEDNAKSNGSGKSFIWSGICFAITGETIQGLKTNLRNIYTSDEDAYVSLDFVVNGDTYLITRAIAPRTDLKIIKNGVDVSGKGIRESEAILANLLPDINQDLIASTILIGQGMPNKFSAFKPSGRKELLERLTKSDFMIEDMKTRIQARHTELDNKLSDLTTKNIMATTQKATYEGTLAPVEAAVAQAVKPDFDTSIADVNEQLNKINKSLADNITLRAELEQKVDDLGKDLLAKTTAKATKKQELFEAYTKATETNRATKASLTAQIATLETELRKISKNPEVCPTCGQKLPNAEHIHQEIESRKNAQSTLKESLAQVTQELSKAESSYNQYDTEIKNQFDTDINTLNTTISTTRNKLAVTRNAITTATSTVEQLKQSLSDLNHNKDNWEKELAAKKATIDDLQAKIAVLDAEIKQTDTSITEVNEHLKCIKQLDILTSRDFRGFILSGIIQYLDRVAKEYAEQVFGHTNLNIYLDGNNLDISFAGKMFDNLSGGEKQRVDLIIQFAIRNLLTTYLNASSNILVLDEITDFMDQTSCDAIMKLIQKELKTVESVFIISHMADTLNIPVDSELKVVKGNDGISTIF